MSQQKEGQLDAEEENVQAKHAAIYTEMSRNECEQHTAIHF